MQIARRTIIKGSGLFFVLDVKHGGNLVADDWETGGWLKRPISLRN